MPDFHRLLVEGVHQLLVVEVEGIVGELLVGVVPNRIALPRIGLVDLDRLVDLVEPARPARGDCEVRHHPPRAGLLIDLLAGLKHLVLRDEPVLGNLRRRIRQQRHLSVAIHVNLFDVIGVFEIVDGLLLVANRLVPTGFPDRLTRLDEAHQPSVVAQKMGVAIDDELCRQCAGTLSRHIRRRCLGHARLEEPAEHLVHRNKRSCHARGGLKETPARQSLPPGEPVAQLFETRLNFALLAALRHRHVLVAGDDLGRHR